MRIIFLIFPFLLSSISSLPLKSDEIEINTLPVGQGDGTVIQCLNNDGYVSILDMGQVRKKLNIEREAVLRELFANYLQNICNLKNIFLTHPDQDHISFIPAIIDKYNEECRKTRLNILIGGTKDLYSNIMRSHWGKHHVYEAGPKGRNGQRCGDSSTANSCEWKQITPSAGKTLSRKVDICGDNRWAFTLMAANYDLEPSLSSKNQKSLVMKLEPFDKPKPSMIFFGDFEGEKNYEELFRAKTKEELESEVLMVPHHGSSSNGNQKPDLYKEVKPQHSIVSADLLASYDHPRCIVIENIVNNRIYNSKKRPREKKDTIWCHKRNEVPKKVKELGTVEYQKSDSFGIYQTISIKLRANENDAINDNFVANEIEIRLDRRSEQATVTVQENK